MSIHDYSLRSCPECKEVFRPDKNQAIALGTGRQKNCFCSMECFRKNSKSKKVPKVSTVKANDYMKTECPQCHIIFTPNSTQLWALKTGKQKSCYCSAECYKKDIPRIRSGSNNPHWKEGRSSNNGYVSIRQEGHYEKSKYVGEHILVMEKIIGRRLLKNEEVHHKNEDKTDNRPENLELLTKSQHMALHATKKHQERGVI